MPALTTCCKVIREFLKICPPLDLPGLWGHVRATSRVRQAPDDEEAALEALRNAFTDEGLCQSKIFIRNHDDVLTLNPLLTGDAFVPLRAKPDHLPFEIVTQAGCLFGPGLPVCKVVRDERYQGEIANAGNQLCVAFSLADVAVLLSVGIPTALATGLDQLEHDDLLEFCQCFGFQRLEMPASANVPQLSLVGWSPAALDLSPPPELKAVLDYLRKVHEYFGFGLEEIYVWRPSEADAERVNFCLQHGTKMDIHQALLASIDKSAEAPFMPPQQAPAEKKPAPAEKKPAPADLSTVLAQVHEAQRHSPSGEIPRQAWQNFEQRLHHDLIAPLLQLGMGEEPLRRNLLTTAASISRLLHAQALWISEKLSQAACGGGRAAAGPLPQTELQQVLALTDRLLLLAKELQPWIQKRRSTNPKTPKTLGTSTTSASVPKSSRS